MFLKVIWSLCSILTLISCASSIKLEPQQATEFDKGVIAADEKTVVPEESQLNAGLVFNILGGELAGQRGEMGSATSLYVAAAKQSKSPEVAQRAVQIALFNKDVVSARSVIELALEKPDSTAQLHHIALLVYLHTGEVESSLHQAQEILSKSNDKRSQAFLTLAEIITRSAKKEVAYQIINSLVAKYQNDAGAYLARSQVAFRFVDLELALSDAKKAVELDNDWSIAYAQWAKVLEKKGDVNGSLEVLESASIKFSDRAIINSYAKLLAKDGQYKKSEQQFKRLLEADVTDHEARFSLGLVYLKNGEVASAKRAFTALVNTESFASRSAYYLGQISYQQKELEQALVWFFSVSEGPAYIDAQVNAARIKNELGKLGDARQILKALRKLFPAHASRLYVLESQFLMAAQKPAELLTLMNGAIEKKPDDLTLRYTRSIASAELDLLVQAEKDLKYILEKKPDNGNALNALGYLLASKTYRFKEARILLEKAIALMPKDPAIMDSLGWLNYRSGRYEEALVLLKKAYMAEPEAEIAYHLGETLWVLGRQNEAKKIWYDAAKRSPQNKYLKEVLQRLK